MENGGASAAKAHRQLKLTLKNKTDQANRKVNLAKYTNMHGIHTSCRLKFVGKKQSLNMIQLKKREKR